MWLPPKELYLNTFVEAWFGIPEQGLRGLDLTLLNSIKHDHPGHPPVRSARLAQTATSSPSGSFAAPRSSSS